MTEQCNTSVGRCLAHFGDRMKRWRVLKPGPYNGRNTVRLAKASQFVLAIEPRRENIKATCDRMVGACNWALIDGRADNLERFHAFDLVFHSGVFYHLADPIAHWRRLVSRFRRVWLNTHYAKDAIADVERQGFDGWIYPEPVNGRRAGLDPGSFWLTRECLLRLLRESFDVTVTWELLDSADGPRIECLCER